MEQIYHKEKNSGGTSYVKGYFITKSTVVGFSAFVIVSITYLLITLELPVWLIIIGALFLSVVALSLLSKSSQGKVENSPEFIVNEIEQYSKIKNSGKIINNFIFGFAECGLIFHNTEFLINHYKEMIIQNQEFIINIDIEKYNRQKLYELDTELQRLIELLETVKKKKKLD